MLELFLNDYNSAIIIMLNNVEKKILIINKDFKISAEGYLESAVS